MPIYSIYLHIPFCAHRCAYCDFNTYAGLEALIPDYVKALCAEIALLGASAANRLDAHTVFFGGGTPSLLTPAELESILSALQRVFNLSPDIEITLEANPGTLALNYLKDVRHIGINRLSLGMQSANPTELRLLERQHDYPEVIQSVVWARKAGFDNLNLDLIFGLPEQSLESWKKTLNLATHLQPEHFSLYALTIEHGTPFGTWAGRGLLSRPDPDLAAEMYEWASDWLNQTGFVQYEISNWARNESPEDLNTIGSPHYSCQHNLQYWRNQPYLGLGAGAHGYAGGYRTINVPTPTAYIDRLQKQISYPFPSTPATLSREWIDRQNEIAETMMMGLRLTGIGISERDFAARFGARLQTTFPRQIERLIGAGLIEWAAGIDGRCLRLTDHGRLLGNQVFVEFI